MERTQVQLTAEQLRRLKEAASSRGISIAAYIREAVETSLAAERTTQARLRAIEATGGFHSGRSDTSRRHDEVLADSYAE